jgi:hypothetical protein
VSMMSRLATELDEILHGAEEDLDDTCGNPPGEDAETTGA